MKKLVSTIMALILVMACSMVVQAGFTPKYSIDMPEIPDIKVELSDEVKEAVKKQIEKMILDKPVVWNAECRTHDKYTSCIITWGKVENATSYKVEIVKQDGTKKAYNVKGNWFYANSRYNKFFAEGIDGATVRVRAYGEEETYSMWSDVVEISDIWQ